MRLRRRDRASARRDGLHRRAGDRPGRWSTRRAPATRSAAAASWGSRARRDLVDALVSRHRFRLVRRRRRWGRLRSSARLPRSPSEGSTASARSSCSSVISGNRQANQRRSTEERRVGRREKSDAAGDRACSRISSATISTACLWRRAALAGRPPARIIGSGFMIGCGDSYCAATCRAQLRHGSHRADGRAGRGA